MVIIHKHWIETERKKHRVTHDWRKDLFAYTYREISKALKDYFGRDDDFCVLYTIRDRENLIVLHDKRWIPVNIDQLRNYL